MAKSRHAAIPGFYGPTCVVDFALIPGSTSNVVNQILQTVNIPVAHKQAILASKSWGMNTSYGIGEVFAHETEKGATLADAVKAEIAMLRDVYDQPVATQAKLDGCGGYEFVRLPQVHERIPEEDRGVRESSD